MSEINIKKAEKGYELSSTVIIEKPLQEVFEFFSEAENLEFLTPNILCFKIVTNTPIKMALGTLIDYKLKLHGIPFRWRSEITEWNPPFSFVDEQRKGPYKYWIHHHSFTEKQGKTLVQDSVKYAVLGPDLVHQIFVKPDLERIFAYRQEKLLQYFKKSV